MIPTHGWVAEFHETFNIPPSDDSRRSRWHLIREEAMEVKEALESGERAKIAQELADLIYVAYGAAILYDIRLDEAIRAVHVANMSKLGVDGKPIFNEHGKVQKGPAYKPPDISAALTPGPTTREDSTCPTCEAITFILEADVV